MTTDLEGSVERLAYSLEGRKDHEQVTYRYASDGRGTLKPIIVTVANLRTILDALASITRERDAMREAGKPFFDLAKTVTTPAPGSPPWWQESQDWTVVFSFAGCAVTLGDLRRAAALVNGEVG